MANSQLIICTAIPRSIRLDPATVEVSVLVTPRLSGDNRLGSYPDWVQWTRRRQQHPLHVVFECAGSTHAVDVPVGGLRPDLWEALFDAQTYARSLYEQAGYRPHGRVFWEAGIEHVAMEKRLG